MSRKCITQSFLIAATSVVLFGCQPQKMDMEKMMQPVERPAELERLNVFVGTWEGTAMVKMAGSEEYTESHGKETYEWGADKWVLITHGEYEAGEGQVMRGYGYWRWDPEAKHYATMWFESDGGVNEGVVTYNEATQMWKFIGKSHNPYTGMKTVGEGTMKVVDDRTMEWTWEAEIPSLFGAKPLMKMQGTSLKQ